MYSDAALYSSQVMDTVQHPTRYELDQAHSAFVEAEPRDLFYRAATELVGRAIHHDGPLSVAEALAVLLQTWNKSYYRFRQFNAAHFADIESLLETYGAQLMELRQRSIESMTPRHSDDIKVLFTEFEQVLGPVGAAKALHLIAPRLFPLWDNAIAVGYGCRLKARGGNATAYVRFMVIVKAQSVALDGERGLGRNPLKAIDEYNYCKYTLRLPAFA